MVSKMCDVDVRAVCKVAQRKSVGVERRHEIKPPTSASAPAAAMKKKKKMKKKNKAVVMKCNICLNQYKPQNLDKHMHSLTHHEAIESLKAGEQKHKCWACDVSLPGLEQFSKHRESAADGGLQQRRAKSSVCSERSQPHDGQKQKNREKMNKKRERKAAKIHGGFYQTTRTKAFGIPGPQAVNSASTDNRCVAFLLNNENKEGRTNTEAGPLSQSQSQAEYHHWQLSKSVSRFQNEDVHFAGDELSRSDIFSSCAEDRSQQSREQDKVVLGQKRSCNANTFESPSMKKQCTRDLSFMKARFMNARFMKASVCPGEVGRVNPPASAARLHFLLQNQITYP
ncbi:uncharacterized protein znf106b [Tachysurus fulvidraco]|uniref:uncharacterized protein znf106b n=1 Tax=Tachysurus fulvidraco TaxID=1234273 RepID=UPI001FEEA468|nr:uncharacterized protein znf106b [Tachysurus fulvidraco]